MTDPDDVAALLTSVADRVGTVAPPDASVLAARARSRRRARRRTALALTVVLALCAGGLVARLGGSSGARRVSTIGPDPAGAGTPSDLARDRWSDLPAPPIETRAQAAVAWTGREMVVWGGATNDGKLLGDGAAFDPATSRWRTIARPPATFPLRYGPDTLWTGRELLVLGGADGRGGPAGIGAAYDPAGDRWRLLAPGPVDGERVLAAAWTGSEAVVLGASGAAAYDPSTDRWRSLPPLPEPPDHPLEQLVIVWTGTRLLVWAMWANSLETGPGTFLLPSGMDLFSLDVGTGTWTAVPHHDDGPRGIATAFWSGHEVVIPPAPDYRGYAHGPPTTGVTGFRYDPSDDAYRPLAPGPIDDGFGPAVWTDKALVLVSAAEQSGGGRSLAVGDMAAWSSSTDTWIRLAHAPAPSAQLVWTGREILMYGPHPTRFGPA